MVFGVLAFSIATFPLSAQQPVSELRIEVKDASGAAVENASGILEDVSTGTRNSFTTDSQGLHTFTRVPPRKHRLDISKSGFAPQSVWIDVQAQTSGTQAIVMEVGAPSFAVDVVGATPLPGADRDLSDFPVPVQVAGAREMEASGALDLSDFLNRRLNGVFLNEIQGNPLQPDLNYRGYTASPLLGTPQGISVYLDGVRLNQPFGDVVSWDLIPRIAISEMALVSGSNPLFGLNTLGGSVSLRSADGSTRPGTTIRLNGGSFGRKVAELEHGGANSAGLNWYLASNLFFEDGWRESSPSNVRQFFGKFGKQGQRTTIALSLAYANNSLIGNGLQEQRFLERDYSSVYTKPDLTANRSPFVTLNLRHSLSSSVTFSGNAYFRHIRTRTLNGDINEDSLDQSVYQPGAAERAALAAAGYTGVPVSGATAENTPFPFWRCIGNVLLRDEPAERCTGLLNRSSAQQRNFGVSGQINWLGTFGAKRNQLTAGAQYDGNSVGFIQSSELGYLNPDRSVTGLGAFGDGVTGGDEDGEPFDTRVDLSGRIHSGSVYATDTLTLADRWSFTASGRYNRMSIDNRDLILPVPGTGSLSGHHVFQRLNPAAGITFRPQRSVGAYFSYTEGSRAPTSIELGCADPNAPCKLPNAMAGDPPLHQVITRTVEGGVRGGTEAKVRWSAGWFRSDTRDDILFVASEQTGFGYFKNFGKTLRQGVELDAHSRLGRLTLGGGYTFLRASFESTEEVNGSGNSSNEEAIDGIPGVEGAIQIQPGDRIPLIPTHQIKVYADVQATSRLLLDVSVVGLSSAWARGNENNRHEPDGTYYLGPGRSPGYAVVHLGGRYDLHRRVELFAQINNLFDRRYYSAAQLGPTGFTANGSFVARPLPPLDGEYPVRQATFYAPGAPRGAWGGVRVRF